MKNLDSQQHTPHAPNTQAANRHEWWSRELQCALDILADPMFHGLKIQIMGQAGCGYHPPTSDPDELERFAREVGLDASYSIVTANGRVSWPILIDLSPGNGDCHSPKRASEGRPARRIAVAERSR
ncbi:MAG: hypothetical protein IIA66_11170 [Planctomycetes bacterium]|nr:hypothetical protein [Planctomycetota bacterium]